MINYIHRLCAKNIICLLKPFFPVTTRVKCLARISLSICLLLGMLDDFFTRSEKTNVKTRATRNLQMSCGADTLFFVNIK